MKHRTSYYCDPLQGAFTINPHQERESILSVSQTHRHVSLAHWSYRNAFVVWRVGVRLRSHTSLNPGIGLYKDEGYEMVIDFVYILFTPRFLFYRHFTHYSHSESNL